MWWSCGGARRGAAFSKPMEARDIVCLALPLLPVLVNNTRLTVMLMLGKAMLGGMRGSGKLRSQQEGSNKRGKSFGKAVHGNVIL